MPNNQFLIKNLEILSREKNLEEKEFAEKILKTQSSFADWCEGLDLEKVHMLIMAADKFDVSLDWLIGLTDERKIVDCRK